MIIHSLIERIRDDELTMAELEAMSDSEFEAATGIPGDVRSVVLANIGPKVVDSPAEELCKLIIEESMGDRRGKVSGKAADIGAEILVCGFRTARGHRVVIDFNVIAEPDWMVL